MEGIEVRLDSGSHSFKLDRCGFEEEENLGGSLREIEALFQIADPLHVEGNGVGARKRDGEQSEGIRQHCAGGIGPEDTGARDGLAGGPIFDPTLQDDRLLPRSGETQILANTGQRTLAGRR